MRKFILIWITLSVAGCTIERILFPICEVTTIDLYTGAVLSVDTMEVPDSACIAEFIRRTS